MSAIARKVFELFQKHERTAITLIAIIIGVIGGYGAILGEFDHLSPGSGQR